ncbi:hypothetical protein KP509_13G021200 [Ceratopteris richardii]|nr:hypothetical protein KP509_13G021200 [Ceratopteris richardii]
MAVKELSLQPPNTTKSPYTASSGKGSSKVSLSSKSSASVPHSEGQYWRFSTANSRAKDRGGVSGEKVCFEFMMKGSCSRGDSCNFKHERSTEKVIAKGACFDFLTKGKCSRGSDCKFRHTMDEDKTSSTETGIRSSAPCWFCLSSPNVDVDLVIEVGDHCYCAMAKGGLVDGHVLLIPIDHFSSMLSLSQPALRELNNYKDKLRKFYNNQQKTIAVFERCVQFRGGSHAHLQVVPIPFSKASQVRSYFVSAAKELGFTLQKIPSSEENFCTENALKHHIEGEKNYFFVELPEGMVLVHVLESGEDIPVQFGREVLAKLLGVPERGDWRACKLSKDDERTLSDKFRREFSVFQER